MALGHTVVQHARDISETMFMPCSMLFPLPRTRPNTRDTVSVRHIAAELPPRDFEVFKCRSASEGALNCRGGVIDALIETPIDYSEQRNWRAIFDMALKLWPLG